MVTIIKFRKTVCVALATALTLGVYAPVAAYGENFEPSSETTLEPPIQLTTSSEDYQEPQPEEPSDGDGDYYEEPSYEEPSYEEPSDGGGGDYQEEQQQEETQPEESETEEETTTYSQEAAFVYTVSQDNEAVLVSCKTPALTKIDVPEIIDGYPVTTISEDTFSQCYNAVEINLPYTIKTISDGAFKMCNSLQYIGVATENKHYKSTNGVLYNFEGTTILSYPSGKPETSYTVAEGVQYISSSCFNSCANLESLKLPPTLAIIGYSAFSGCINLKELTVTNDVELSESMLTNCPLETIYGYENSNAEDYALLYGINFESIGILETEMASVTTAETSEEVTTVVETEPVEDATGESLVYYAPERESTDSTQKVVIAIIVVALVSFVLIVATRSRHDVDDDDEDEDEEDEKDDEGEDGTDEGDEPQGADDSSEEGDD